MTDINLDKLDRAIINALQGGFPLTDRPFAEVASWLNIEESELLERIEKMLADKVLSRFGPMYNTDRLGGAVTLAAMSVPPGQFDQVSQVVNSHREVAHNYARNHEFNMWFVIAGDNRKIIDQVISAIEKETGMPVYDFPKQKEYFIGLRFEA